MAPRAQWKGYLKLSLVSCPVALFSAASTSERISFHLINRATGNRLKQQYIDSVTSDFVEPEDRIRGYEIGKGHYIPLEPEEIKDVQIESTHTIDIDQFVTARRNCGSVAATDRSRLAIFPLSSGFSSATLRFPSMIVTYV